MEYVDVLISQILGMYKKDQPSPLLEKALISLRPILIEDQTLLNKIRIIFNRGHQTDFTDEIISVLITNFKISNDRINRNPLIKSIDICYKNMLRDDISLDILILYDEKHPEYRELAKKIKTSNLSEEYYLHIKNFLENATFSSKELFLGCLSEAIEQKLSLRDFIFKNGSERRQVRAKAMSSIAMISAALGDSLGYMDGNWFNMEIEKLTGGMSECELQELLEKITNPNDVLKSVISENYQIISAKIVDALKMIIKNEQKQEETEADEPEVAEDLITHKVYYGLELGQENLNKVIALAYKNGIINDKRLQQVNNTQKLTAIELSMILDSLFSDDFSIGAYNTTRASMKKIYYKLGVRTSTLKKIISLSYKEGIINDERLEELNSSPKKLKLTGKELSSIMNSRLMF